MTPKAGHTFTAGPATVLRSKRPSDGEHDFAVNCEGAPVIAEAFGRAADGEGSILPAEANAHLIAEAFNVAHETGLTPRQLAEQRDELLAALKFYADRRRYDGANQKPIDGDCYAPANAAYMQDVTRDGGQIARAAIAKATAGGAV